MLTKIKDQKTLSEWRSGGSFTFLSPGGLFSHSLSTFLTFSGICFWMNEWKTMAFWEKLFLFCPAEGQLRKLIPVQVLVPVNVALLRDLVDSWDKACGVKCCRRPWLWLSEQLSMNHSVGGLIPSSSGRRVKVFLDKTHKPYRSAII